MPFFSPIIPPLNLITILHLIELFKNILKVVKVTPSTIDIFKITES